MPTNGNDSDDSKASSVSRRQVVKTVSAVGVGGALAGCDSNDPATDTPTSGDGGDGGDGGGDGGDGGDGTDTATEGEEPLPNVDTPFRYPAEDEVLEGEMNEFHPQFNDGNSWTTNARFGNRHVYSQEWVPEDDDGYEHFPDQNEIHFFLKDRLYWHPAQENKNLDPVTAEDIVFGEEFRRMVEEAAPDGEATPNPLFEDWQVGDDEKTLVIKLNEDGYLLSNVLSEMSRYWIHFYRNGWARDFYERLEDATTDDAKADIHEEIIGFNYNIKENQAVSGPYYAEQASPTDAVLQRVDDHWTQYQVNWDECHRTSQDGYQAARNDRIDQEFSIPDRVDSPPENLKILMSGQAAEFESIVVNYGPQGDLDPWLRVDVEDSSQLANGDAELAETGTAEQKHAKVFQAMTLATSFEDAITNRFGPKTVEYAGLPDLPGPTNAKILAEEFPDVVDAIPNYVEQNTDLAEEKLSEAGLEKQNGTWIKPDGDALTLELSSYEWSRSFISTIVEDLTDIGVKANHITRDGSMFSDFNEGTGYGIAQAWGSHMAPPGLGLKNVFGGAWPNRNVPRYFEAPPVGEFDGDATETYDIKELGAEFSTVPHEDQMDKVRQALWAFYYHMPKLHIAPYAPTTAVNAQHFDWPEHPDWDGQTYVPITDEDASDYWLTVYGVYENMGGGKAPVMAKEN